jgi:hypothetical protein
MTDEEINKKFDVVADLMAQMAANMSKLSEKVDRTHDSVVALLAIAEIHEREIESLKDAQTETGEKLNALINTVERFISEGGKQ